MFEYLTGCGPLDAADPADESLLPLGLLMRDAVLADLQCVAGCRVTAAVNDHAAAPVGVVATASALPGESALDFVARQAALHDSCWVIAPESGGLLVHLQEAVGVSRWLGCERSALVLASSKRATLRRLAEHGIGTPLAFEHAPEVRRWVVKPDDGAGAMGARVHHDEGAAFDDWQQRSRAGTPMAIEPWVDGEALSISLLCSDRGAELLSINRQQIRIDAGGALAFEGVDVNVQTIDSSQGRTLQRLADVVGRAIPGLRGFVGIDLVWHAQRGPVVIEVNPRVTCAYVGLSASLERNLAAEVLALHRGEFAS